MRLFQYSSVALALLCGSQVFAQKISVKGTLLNAEPAQKVYLFNYFGAEITKADSTTLNGKQFVFNFPKGLTRGFYRIGLNANKSFALILGKESEVTLSADLNNAESMTFEKSPENELYLKYTDYNRIFGKNVNGLQQQANTLSPLQETDPQRFGDEMTKLKSRFDSLGNEQNKFYEQLQAGSKNLFVGKVAGFFWVSPKTDSSNFFTTESLKDPEYLRGDMIPSKLNVYFQRFVAQDLEAYKSAASNLIKVAPEKSQAREVMYVSLIQFFGQFDQGFSRKLAEQYNGEFKKSERAKKIMAKMPQAQPEEGEKAPDIKLADRDGKEIALSSLKGKVVLLDFWASWCGPCRMENPNVVKAYEKYKEKGFTIFSVSLDENKERWLQAIEKDKLTWPSHVSDLKGWRSAGAAVYKVNSIPATFLLDRDGKIIGKNLRGAALEDKLKSLLDK